jgi:hypothetical protein
MKLTIFLNGKSAETYLDEKLKTCKEIDELPRELTDCGCCERHKINFPVIGNPIKFNLFKDRGTNVCKCPCRHIARHICREWDLVNEVEDLTSEDFSEDSDSTGSLEDFIVPDKGLKTREKKKLNNVLKKLTR